VVTFHASVENDDDTFLFSTDGTWEGTEQLTVEGSGEEPDSMKVVNGKLYFAAYNSKGREPWVSDGTKTGTHMIADVYYDTSWSEPYGFTGYKGAVYFSAYSKDENGTSLGRELYKTNGTDTGATLVKDINPASKSSSPEALKVWNGTLYFSAHDTNYDWAIWKTDGTVEGTEKLFVDKNWNYIRPIIALGDKLLFRADGDGNEPTSGVEPSFYIEEYTLFSYDGSVGEDGNATDPVALIGGSILGNFKPIDADGDDVKETLLFMANDDDNTTEEGEPLTALYGTNGTTDGTVLIKGGLCPQWTLDGEEEEEEEEEEE
jgi:ELWxxDGT repeat protein